VLYCAVRCNHHGPFTGAEAFFAVPLLSNPIQHFPTRYPALPFRALLPPRPLRGSKLSFRSDAPRCRPVPSDAKLCATVLPPRPLRGSKLSFRSRTFRSRTLRSDALLSIAMHSNLHGSFGSRSFPAIRYLPYGALRRLPTLTNALHLNTIITALPGAEAFNRAVAEAFNPPLRAPTPCAPKRCTAMLCAPTTTTPSGVEAFNETKRYAALHCRTLPCRAVRYKQHDPFGGRSFQSNTVRSIADPRNAMPPNVLRPTPIWSTSPPPAVTVPPGTEAFQQCYPNALPCRVLQGIPQRHDAVQSHDPFGGRSFQSSHCALAVRHRDPRLEAVGPSERSRVG